MIKKIDVVKKAVQRLPDEFTSSELTHEIIKIGHGHYCDNPHNRFHEQLRKLGIYNECPGSKKWFKPSCMITEEKFHEQLHQLDIHIKPSCMITEEKFHVKNVKNAINLLKKLGYRIWKPEFKEV